jgi:hypothetical protein
MDRPCSRSGSHSPPLGGMRIARYHPAPWGEQLLLLAGRARVASAATNLTARVGAAPRGGLTPVCGTCRHGGARGESGAAAAAPPPNRSPQGWHAGHLATGNVGEGRMSPGTRDTFAWLRARVGTAGWGSGRTRAWPPAASTRPTTTAHAVATASGREAVIITCPRLPDRISAPVGGCRAGCGWLSSATSTGRSIG